MPRTSRDSWFTAICSPLRHARNAVDEDLGSTAVSMLPSEIIADRYRIEKTLGTGGFGDTYLVLDLLIDRRFAIKLAGTDTPEFAERFRSEANLLSRVDNPHIARVFD